MQKLNIILPGKVGVKARPRVTKAGITYTRAKTRAYEDKLREAAAQAMKEAVIGPMIGPVSVHMIIKIEPPKSWSARRKAQALSGNIRPTSRPDMDNQIKLLDALNPYEAKGFAGVWLDDSQVCSITACRFYGDPGLTIVVTALDAEPSS